MIVFDLECRGGGHRFEGWFASSDDFAGQQARGLVECPQCGSGDVIKAPMAPHLARKGNQRAENGATPSPSADALAPPSSPAPSPQMMAAAELLPPQAQAALMKLAEFQAEVLKKSRWVGGKFADDARAMHYGDKEVEPIHGQASLQEAKSLFDEGIDVAPVLFPIAPPGEVN